MKSLISYSPTGRRKSNELSHAAYHPASFPGLKPGRRPPATSGIFCSGIPFFWHRSLPVVAQAAGGRGRTLYGGDAKDKPLFYQSFLAAAAAGKSTGRGSACLRPDRESG